MTYGQISALYRRHVQAHDFSDYRAAIIASAIANYGFRTPKEMAQPWWFFPGLKKWFQSLKEERSPESQIELLRGWYSTGKIIKSAGEPTEKEASDVE